MTAAVLHRPLRGSRISSFYPVKSLPSLSSLDSAFQLQEYISLLIRLDVHDVDSIVSVPGRNSGSGKEGGEEREMETTKGEEKTERAEEKERKNEVTVDEFCWIYEQLRRLAQDLSHPLITMLQNECTRASCPEMKAGEWLYLCVAHGNDGAMEQCCAIDYILHTLDSATALLNSPRAFPSRLSIPQTSHRHFSSLARRLGRIFAHAYFHHREAFEQAEAESSLYARFLALTSKFDLVPTEFLVIPPRLEERDGAGDEGEVRMPRLLRPGMGSDERQHTEAVEVPIDGNEDWGKILERPKSKSPPGLSPGEGEHPRKFGRNRTDTMVFTDTFSDLVARGDERGAVDEYGAGPSGIRRDEMEDIIIGGEGSEDVGMSGLVDTADEPASIAEQTVAPVTSEGAATTLPVEAGEDPVEFQPLPRTVSPTFPLPILDPTGPATIASSAVPDATDIVSTQAPEADEGQSVPIEEVARENEETKVEEPEQPTETETPVEVIAEPQPEEEKDITEPQSPADPEPPARIAEAISTPDASTTAEELPSAEPTEESEYTPPAPVEEDVKIESTGTDEVLSTEQSDNSPADVQPDSSASPESPEVSEEKEGAPQEDDEEKA